MTLDLTLSPLYRINGQEIASLPGLVALTPPQNAARGREKDRLIVYLLLTGNSTFSTSEYMQVAKDAANLFYQTSGSLTSALRTAADLVNKTLLERNMASSKHGKYAIGWLTLAALRDTQCTLALSGPMHAYWFGQNEMRHIHEPAASGKGLGTNQTTNVHYSQTTLSAGDRLLFFGRAPDAWSITLNDPSPSSLDAMRRRLSALTQDDLNAVLTQATDGAGIFNLLSGGMPEPKADSTAPLASRPTSQLTPPAQVVSTPEASATAAPVAHVVQASSYTTSPQQEEAPRANSPLASLPRNTGPRDFPASIPRIQPAPVESISIKEETAPPVIAVEENLEAEEVIPARAAQPAVPREPSARARQTAKALATGIQSTRRISETINEKLKNFLPRLLPNTENNETFAPSNLFMASIAIIVPLSVVVIMFVIYSKYGLNPQYEEYLRQAREQQAQAITLSDPMEQLRTWDNVISDLNLAEAHRVTSETTALRIEANANLDKLRGIIRLQFNPAFSINLGIKISRMAANETDLYLLNAETGEALRAQSSNDGRGFQLDTTFNCKPGVYGKYTVGNLVDILTLPVLNSVNATLLGIDAAGNLLYCAPGQVAQAIPLPPPDTNWNRVTAVTLDGGNLYVLDALARAIWVYNSKDGMFIDRPYFFFGGQTPEKQDVIDLVISGDDLYLLHGDGHLSTCSYSRIESKPTRCQDPTPLVNPFAAYQGADLFASANFTQMLFTALPNQSILLLNADTQGVLRFAPRSLELQSQFLPATGTTPPISSGPAGAVAVGPNHVLYLAINGQIYFATDMP